MDFTNALKLSMEPRIFLFKDTWPRNAKVWKMLLSGSKAMVNIKSATHFFKCQIAQLFKFKFTTKHTELISKKYGLQLNRDKCVAIAMNTDGHIHFEDGTCLEKQFETTYLWNELNREVNILLHEIPNKVQQVMGTWMQLHVYWEATNASNK